VIGSRLIGNPEIRAEESGSKLRNKFLGGVSFLSKPALQVAVQAVRGSAPVDALVSKGRVVRGGFPKESEGGQLNEVVRRIVKRAVPAVPDFRANVVKELLGGFDTLRLGLRFNRRQRESVNLLGVEDVVATRQRSPVRANAWRR